MASVDPLCSLLGLIELKHCAIQIYWRNQKRLRGFARSSKGFFSFNLSKKSKLTYSEGSIGMLNTQKKESMKNESTRSEEVT